MLPIINNCQNLLTPNYYNMQEYKSATKGDLIPAIVVQFRTLVDFICRVDEWRAMGEYRGFLKEYSIKPQEIKKVHKLFLNPDQFPTREWAG